MSIYLSKRNNVLVKKINNKQILQKDKSNITNEYSELDYFKNFIKTHKSKKYQIIYI